MEDKMRIQEFFEESDGQLSSARLYTFIALITGVILTFTGGSYDLIITYLGFAFGGKVASKLTEKGADNAKSNSKG